MIDGLKPYPEYKDSGQPWLGTIPKHWEVMRNGRLFAQRNQTGFSELPILEVSLKTGVRVRNFDESKRKQVMTDRAKYKRARQGDIAYNMMRMWQGAVGRVPVDGLVSPAYVVARPLEGTNALYFSYLFRTAAYRQEVNNASRGIVSDRNRLYWVDFKQLPSVVPPPEEQADIVRFLGDANRRIDQAIRAKKKLIVLLNEQKQATIDQVVTRGLDPSVKFKDSGIAWLGAIPAHWEVISLRMRYSVDLGKMLDAKRILGSHLVSYLRNRDVQWDRIIVDDLPSMDIRPEEFPRYLVKQGDLLVCEGGEVGRCAFWNNQLPICGFQKALHRIRALDITRDYPRFLFYLMNLAAGKSVFSADGNENTIAHLTCEKLRRHRFPFPPIEEQRRIADLLDRILQQHHVTLGCAEREIDLLREYRARLIADVVTGKLDVREAARHLPDEAEEPTTMEADNGDMESGLELDEAVEEAEA